MWESQQLTSQSTYNNTGQHPTISPESYGTISPEMLPSLVQCEMLPHLGWLGSYWFICLRRVFQNNVTGLSDGLSSTSALLLLSGVIVARHNESIIKFVANQTLLILSIHCCNHNYSACGTSIGDYSINIWLDMAYTCITDSVTTTLKCRCVYFLLILKFLYNPQTNRTSW